MASLPPLQVRNEWLVRALPKSIQAIKLGRNSKLATFRSSSVIEPLVENQRAVACQQRTEKYVVFCLYVKPESRQ